MVSRRQFGAVTSPYGRNNRHRNLNAWLIAGLALAAVLATPSLGAAADGPESGGSKPQEQATGKGGDPFSGRVVRRHVNAGSLVKFRARSLEATGKSAGVHKRAVLKIQIRRDGARRWTTIEQITGLTSKATTLRWRAAKPGRYKARAMLTVAGVRKTDALGRFNVYRGAHASWYGGGGTTACGQHLTDSTMGVAHKTLPCGTKVVFRYGNRTAVARVIDRGPFIAGREWDLTVALKRAIGFGDVGTVYTTR